MLMKHKNKRMKNYFQENNIKSSIKYNSFTTIAYRVTLIQPTIFKNLFYSDILFSCEYIICEIF